jgi:hypothetical protein
VQFVALVGGEAQVPPATWAPQSALDGAAAAFQQEAARGKGGDGEGDEHQDGDENPDQVRQCSAHRRSCLPPAPA